MPRTPVEHVNALNIRVNAPWKASTHVRKSSPCKVYNKGGVQGLNGILTPKRSTNKRKPRTVVARDTSISYADRLKAFGAIDVD